LGFAAIGSLAVRADGTLFGSVNITTAVATIIGPFGTILVPGPTPADGRGSATIEGMEAIAFDGAGSLWGSTSSRGAAGPPSALFRINQATGAAAFVASIADVGGTSPSGGVTSLQFRNGGTLFGGTGREVTPALDGGRLIRINPLSGLFVFSGALPAAPGTSLGDLAGGRTLLREPGSYPPCRWPHPSHFLGLDSGQHGALWDHLGSPSLCGWRRLRRSIERHHWHGWLLDLQV
jgi:hypothetical protein